MLHVSRTPTIPPVVDAAFVAGRPDAVLADVRWYLDGRNGLTAFEAGHLPGARWVDLERDLSAHDRSPTDGRHPFPSPEQFASAMSRLGIGDDTTVVAYDDSGGGTAGRLVVMLRMIGRDAALLDGGLRAWSGPVESGPSRGTAAARFTATPWPQDRFASADDAAGLASRGGAVIDARAAERFRGEVVVADPRPGHIPGARSAPWTAVLDDAGRIRDREDLRAHFAAVAPTAPTDAVAYCGSGVSACMNIVAMEHAGLRPARLFVASWSGWAADPERPAETGA
jgi:thiosulfate/3-mercaptopyruvate sulfurtransferase